MSEKLPKVLSISLSTWRKDSGIHTQTDLFKYYDPERVAQIYTKSDLPDTPVCNNFFRISENEVIKSVLTRKRVGCRVINGAKSDEATRQAVKEEKELYKKAHKKKSWLLTLAREVVWFLGNWKTKALDDFIREENPDVYFIPIYPVIYMGWIQLYVLKKFPKPYVCYLADDNYSYKPCGRNLFSYLHRFFLRKVVRKLAIHCSEMFVITNTQVEETDRLFGTNSVVLTKGIDFEEREYIEPLLSTPIRMVYTGNLLIGRADSLVEISKAMAQINKETEKVNLDIYSATVLDDNIMAILNANGCHFKGCVPKNEVDSIQQAADIVIFVESLEKKHRYDARLSFSTKLTDYFKNGKCIFAIGDKSIAPIIYLYENDCAIIVNEYSEIEGKLSELVECPGKIKEYSKKAFETGKKNHNSVNVKEVFLSAFVRAARNDGV
ncbi:MAG: hypothetical protein IJ043_09520 [Clostridia bacterium]|nr:hypothetical protein [Clostridia bacterium]